MYGFKSFADRTTLELTPGITVVVGPNGCGKSNIADALRWVLGEQSVRMLRGTRMDDIIFNGAAARKPLGFTEVSVTMDHSDGSLGLDYREITVTRRLYRDGTSEYLLNRHTCRLKEILEMFMDTGIGKEAYSFIGQGRIEEILNSRPEERRLIFEEAAGIQKYKNRKREAERRLAETDENLLRVNDIIRELHAQLEPLQAQASAARYHLDLRCALKNIEVSLFVHEAQALNRRIRETDALCRKAADAAIQRQAEAASKEYKLTTSQITLDQEQPVLLKLQRETQSQSSELEKTCMQVSLAEEKLRNLQQQAADLEIAVRELNQQYAAMQAGKQQDRKELTETVAAKEKLSGELVELEKLLSAAQSLPEADQVLLEQAELELLLSEIRSLQVEYDRFRLKSEQLALRQDWLQQEKIKKAEELSLLEEKTENLLAAKIAGQQELENLLAKKHAAQQTAKELASQGEMLDKQSLQGEKQLAEIGGQLRLLQELEANLTGYGHGVKMVLEAKKSNKVNLAGIFGTVADILRVPPPYVAAVEAALGSTLLNLVAEDDTVAKAAIAWLKQIKGGRATFLPMNLLAEQQSYGTTANLKLIDGYFGVASQLVETPSHFRKVADMLLSRVHIVRDMDTAVTVARALRFRERVATLDGEVIQPGGAMTGGREKRQGGILSRRRDVEDLRQTFAREQEQLLSLARVRTSLSDKLETTLQGSKSLDEQCLRHEQTLSFYERELVSLREQSMLLRTSLVSLEHEAGILSEQAGESVAAEREALEKLDMLAGKERELRLALMQLQEKLANRKQEEKHLRERHTECRIHLAALGNKQEFLEEVKERQAGVEQNLTAAIRLKEAELKKCRTLCPGLLDELAASREAAAALERSLKALFSELSDKEKTVRTLASQLRHEREELRQSEKEFSALERQQHRLELEREKLEHELQAVLARLRHSWQLEFAEAEAVAVPVAECSAAYKQAEELKEALQALGAVNLGAIEEYSRVKERVDFLTAQRNDLSAAGRDLQKIIREIDRLMGEKFAASFAVLNESFGLVFKELFGGGKSMLRLADPQNLLESGVEIIAQPPGKRLQHLSLLSGGEKALAAIALLFSFLRVKPVPFCILDEIDTALDEANLARFNTYLQRLAGKIQFILISHRKKTMERADMLYGVTMEEPGVAKLISVRLGTATHLESSAG
jgi:chromosome segregation protein